MRSFDKLLTQFASGDTVKFWSPRQQKFAVAISRTTSCQEYCGRSTQGVAEKEGERNVLEEGLNTTKSLDALKEQEAEFWKKNKQHRKIISDETASPSERETAEGRVEERQEELARLRTQIEDRERERARPLRGRVKKIFKGHGLTAVSILLAAGATICAVIGAIANSLKATNKAL